MLRSALFFNYLRSDLPLSRKSDPQERKKAWFHLRMSRILFAARLRWLNTILAVCEYMSFAKSWQEKGCISQAETWQVKYILMKDFD